MKGIGSSNENMNSYAKDMSIYFGYLEYLISLFVV